MLEPALKFATVPPVTATSPDVKSDEAKDSVAVTEKLPVTVVAAAEDKVTVGPRMSIERVKVLDAEFALPAASVALLVMTFPLNTHFAFYSAFWGLVFWWLLATWCAALASGEET